MRKKRKSDSGGFNIWRSYSDMMAGVLLLFVLIMCVTLFQAQKNYDDSVREKDERVAMEREYTSELQERQQQLDLLAQQLEEQQKQLEEQTKTLSAQKNRLEEQSSKLEEQTAQLASQQSKLEEQTAQLNTQQQKLEEQTTQLSMQQQKLEEQSAKLKEQENQMQAQKVALDEKTRLLTEQQQKIDNIIGVKADVVEALKLEFSQSNINVNIDPDSGAMTLDSSVIFDYDEMILKEEGQAVLAQVLPIYCSVLIKEEYLPYLAEITIDGYTDSLGDYYYNLHLSQGRSQAVAEYLLELMPEFFTDEQITVLMDHLTVNAHSMSDFIYDADGNVDDDASRRVEVKFRLKDEEMIQELNKILASQ